MVTPSFGVSRTFDVTLGRLWAAFTNGDELAQWAPPPGAAVLRNEMNLSVGGSYRFGLTTRDGVSVWGAWDIRRVEPPELLTFVLSFTDQYGVLERNPLAPDWPQWLKAEFRFALQGGGATVTMNLSPLDSSASEIAAFRRSFAALSRESERALDALDARLRL